LKPHKRQVLVTGSRGFIGSNLVISLKELPATQVLEFTRESSLQDLKSLVDQSDAVIHLAGENRPVDPIDFTKNNTNLTLNLCNIIHSTKRNIPLIFASSIQAEQNNLYGVSKQAAENIIENYVTETNNSAIIYRLPGVFGKWCKPNYNSVVATFCYNIARGKPIEINDNNKKVHLVYIDDVIDSFIKALKKPVVGFLYKNVKPEYKITLEELVNEITLFKNSRSSLISERVGLGITRALYSTYISYLPIKNFIYDLTEHRDKRGNFVEILKTKDSGQFSFFTILPSKTRGSHYHHSKTEKFILIKGKAKMCFRNLFTGESTTIHISDNKIQVVDTIPGWVHDITNIGHQDAIVMLWANEIYDHNQPDCIACEV
jgi:UDP-2-acetamido-2,6-beta-L-arabino-hexul-4-ose reductase